MSHVQILNASVSVLKALYTIALFTAKAIVYIGIALYVVGELLLSELETAPVKAVEVPEIVAVEQSIPEVPEIVAGDLAPVPCTKSAAKTMPTAVKAIEVPFKAEPTMFDGVKAIELRKVCQSAGIKWRNAHGLSKHLTRSEMVTALVG